MTCWLPNIDIAIADQPEIFLDQMSGLGRASSRFDVERNPDAINKVGFHAVNFQCGEDAVHEGLGFLMIVRPTDTSRVEIEVSARRWREDPVTYATYVETARSLVGPLLSAFNQANSTRYRLRIERVQADRFKLSERTTTLLDRFALLANKRSLHPLDWRHFYSLVAEGRQEIPEAQLRSLLCGKGFSFDVADHLATIYAHLWAFKRLR